MKQKIISIVSIFILIIIGLSLYILTLRGISGNPRLSQFKNNLDQATKPFELSPERGRYLLIMALGENKTFALTKEMAIIGYPDVGYKGDKYYVYFAPGVSLLALPFYLIGKTYGLAQLFSFSVISIFAVLNLVFLYLISRYIFKLNTTISIFIPILFGFATTSWSYATTLYQHHVTLFFLLTGFYSAWRFKYSSHYGWLYSLYVWFAYGVSIFLDYPNILLLSPIMLYHFISAFESKKTSTRIKVKFKVSYLLTSIMFFALVFLHGYFNYIHYGSPTKLSGSLSSLQEIPSSKNTRSDSNKQEVEKVEASKSLSNFFQEVQFPKGVSILTGSRDRGLILYSPILILGLIGVFISIKKANLEETTSISIIIVNLFLYSSWGDPWGGWAYGPRYLIISMAILSIFVGTLLKHNYNSLKKFALRFITLLLFSYSSAIALLGALTTNAVPPKIEADFLKMHYNFLLNLDFLVNNRSSSFVYNTFFSHSINLVQFFFIIWSFLQFIVVLLLFIVPLIHKDESVI